MPRYGLQVALQDLFEGLSTVLATWPWNCVYIGLYASPRKAAVRTGPRHFADAVAAERQGSARLPGHRAFACWTKSTTEPM